MIPEKYQSFADTNNGLNARPCFIPEIVESLQEFLSKDYLFKDNIFNEYVSVFKDYLFNDKYNNLIGIEEFSFASYTHGTIQAFEDFYSRHSDRRLRWIEGDFAYHKIASRSYGFQGKELISKKDLREGDSFVISVPFSASCEIFYDLDEILKICDNRSIPVLLDCAYLPISQGVKLDVTHKSIDSLCFSLSKAYFGIERLRTGLRLKRKFEDDPTDFFNEFSMFNHSGAYVAMSLLNKFPPSYLIDLLSPKYKKLCAENNFKTNNSVVFASIESHHPDYSFYKSGKSIFSRKCLSEELAYLLKVY